MDKNTKVKPIVWVRFEFQLESTHSVVAHLCPYDGHHCGDQHSILHFIPTKPTLDRKDLHTYHGSMLGFYSIKILK